MSKRKIKHRGDKNVTIDFKWVVGSAAYWKRIQKTKKQLERWK